ncbi:MAG: hypothetical protein QF450_05395 [Rhodospirillales bacterium]|jgi:hypothetical protein|nr:hypothetical protein [Rhodospirillales bacterium]HJO73424.1 hypothetical protein [Rhodospirillales bacterium]
MKILALHSGLFPDRETVEAGLVELAAGNDLDRIDLAAGDMVEADWDRALAEILQADLIVTT